MQLSYPHGSSHAAEVCAASSTLKRVCNACGGTPPKFWTFSVEIGRVVRYAIFSSALQRTGNRATEDCLIAFKLKILSRNVVLYTDSYSRKFAQVIMIITLLQRTKTFLALFSGGNKDVLLLLLLGGERGGGQGGITVYLQPSVYATSCGGRLSNTR